eukprot:scaffold18456_cov23-Tisochrysis_lutea.AAC.6
MTKSIGRKSNSRYMARRLAARMSDKLYHAPCAASELCCCERAFKVGLNFHISCVSPATQDAQKRRGHGMQAQDCSRDACSRTPLADMQSQVQSPWFSMYVRAPVSCRTAKGEHAHGHLLAAAAAAERASTAAGIVDDLYTRNCARGDGESAFVMLGAWYLECGGDRNRAIKCYERALTINPASVSAS